MILALLSIPEDGRGPAPHFRWHLHGPARLGCSPTDTAFTAPSGVVAVAPSGVASSAKDVTEAYGRHGTSCVQHLRGSFAFALYDPAETLLFVASDLTCRGPFAWWTDGHALAAGTRLLELLRYRPVRPRLDEVFLAHTLSGFIMPEPGSTVVQGFRRLLPGEAIVARPDRISVARVDTLKPRSFAASTRPAQLYDAFWETLGGALTRAVPPDVRPCLSLSGGIDSAVVGAALARVRGSIDAVSLVAPRHADDGERSGVRAFARANNVNLREIDCSELIAYPQLDGELRDDPSLIPLGFMPGRIAMWHAAASAGFNAIVDGEGGDELFDAFVSPLHAVAARRWPLAWRYFRSVERGRRTLVWDSLITPHLPMQARRALLRRSKRHLPALPSYFTPEAADAPSMRAASEQYLHSFVHRPLRSAVEEWLAWPFFLGAAVSQRQSASGLGVRLVSPLLDRDVVELVLGLPVDALLSDENDKAFLRNASAGVIPGETRQRPKDTRMAVQLDWAILTQPATRAILRDRNVRDRLADWVRFERVEGILDSVERGYSPTDRQRLQLECLVTFAEWYGRASREYGVE
jgi:asparagine synthase (glutamine-hydrolysing)